MPYHENTLNRRRPKAASDGHSNATFYGSCMKACAFLLLPLLLYMVLKLPSFTSHTTAKDSLPILPNVISEGGLGGTSSTSTEPHPDAVTAAVYAKMNRLLVDMQLKTEHHLAEMKRIVQVDIQNIKAQLAEVNSNSQLDLKKEISALEKQISNYQAESQSTAASLKLKVENLEAENVNLSEELSSIKLTPNNDNNNNDKTSFFKALFKTLKDTLQLKNKYLTPELENAMENWFRVRMQVHKAILSRDFALESQGGSVISTRCSETYRSRSACVTFYGFPLWYQSESPRRVIQGDPVLLPGKCWAFPGEQGTLFISLSHPVSITHVTLDHLPRYKAPLGSINSAPKDFEVFGMNNENEAGTLLGKFTYDQDGEPIQTFKLPSQSAIHHFVELRVLTNWGQNEYTCLYRFRVHGKVAST
ncbi:SUN domain-containing protein 3-like isoform X2 [Gouania willdenowi]|nr:SUN domain-containing protein 3-like isoform X2 [Gouania willdenowi]XP_028327107.1 SUN domain-containing protein 3-like isoform X2 [Gouania willdenowi]